MFGRRQCPTPTPEQQTVMDLVRFIDAAPDDELLYAYGVNIESASRALPDGETAMVIIKQHCGSPGYHVACGEFDVGAGFADAFIHRIIDRAKALEKARQDAKAERIRADVQRSLSQANV